MKLMCVAPYLLEDIWPMVEKKLDDGYAVGDEGVPDNIFERLHNGHACLWIVVDDQMRIPAAMVTEILLRRSGKVLWMTACGGARMAEWKHLLSEIEEYAKREGCVKVGMSGRFGWQRVLDGYEPTRVTLEKRI